MADSTWPVTKDDPIVEILAHVGTSDNIDGNGMPMSGWMRRIDTGVRGLQDTVGDDADATTVPGTLRFDLGNVRTRRVTSTPSTTVPIPDADTTDLFILSALSTPATFGVPTGTPNEGQAIIVRIKDNGTARALAWNAAYRASPDIALPTTTTVGKTLYLGFVYNSVDGKWDLLALLDNV
jgi:hypothetical protein